ncbi:MAG TPA: hypothetical protein VNG35_12205 [Gemmatimonadales bacterium]|jgi:hypothetical protein|nr:hypothetical protein [Gemmatimonadales bacterium]
MARVTRTVKYTPSSDARADKKAGIKPGSKRDIALDKSRGVKDKGK